MRFENSVVINQPVEKVFEFVTNINNNPKWQTDILELKLTTEGPLGLGSMYHCVNRFMGRRIETVGIITDYEPDNRCAFRIKSGTVTGESSFLFEPVNGGTKFTTIGDIELRYLKLAKVIVKHKIKQQLRNDMVKLKDLLENGNHV
jgi:uncharacterized membrane protein